jgi:hypothetical protein
MDTEIQFDRVERPIGASACTSCRSALLGSYFQANGQVLCERCAGAIRKLFVSGEGGFGRFLKAAVFGIGGGLLGAAVYTASLALMHINLALITILIGFLVGKMVRQGSENRGGIGYQIMAVLITYGMIGASIVLSEMFTSDDTRHGILGKIFIVAIGAVAGPVIAATNSPLGGLITIFGLMQAWKMNKGVVVNITGPHALASSAGHDSIDPTIAQNQPAPVLPPIPPQSA